MFFITFHFERLIASTITAKTPTNIKNLANPIPSVTLNAVKNGVFDAAANAEIAGVSRSTWLFLILSPLIKDLKAVVT